MQVEIVGSIKEPNFHVAKSVAEVTRYNQFYLLWKHIFFVFNIIYLGPQGLKQEFPDAFSDPKIQPLFEFDWHIYLCSKKRVGHVTSRTLFELQLLI